MGGGASVPHPSGVAVWQEDVAQLDFEMERNLSMLDRIGERIAALERKAALLPPEHRALYAVQAARNYAEHCAAAEAERITGGMRPTDKQAREKQRQAEMKRRERQAAYLKRQKIARSAARRAALQDLPALESVAKGSEDERAAQEKREEKRLARQKAAQERREYREQNPNWVEELREKREQEKALRKQRMKAKKLMAEQFSGPFGNLDGRSILEKFDANHDGVLDKEEQTNFAMAFGDEYKDAILARMVEIDENGDGKVDVIELAQFLVGDTESDEEEEEEEAQAQRRGSTDRAAASDIELITLESTQPSQPPHTSGGKTKADDKKSGRLAFWKKRVGKSEG